MQVVANGVLCLTIHPSVHPPFTSLFLDMSHVSYNTLNMSHIHLIKVVWSPILLTFVDQPVEVTIPSILRQKKDKQTPMY